MVSKTKKRCELMIIALLLIQLWFNCICVYGQDLNIQVPETKPQSDSLNESTLLPTFRYHRYNIEPYTKAFIDLILPLDAKKVKIEVVDAQDLSSELTNESLREKGLKIIKHKRHRGNTSKRELYEEEKLSTNKAIFDLQKVNNQQYITKFIDYEIFKVALNGLPSASYTVEAVIDDTYTTSTKIFTKPDFRIDDISPSIINTGVESILTIEGKNLDLFTKVNFNSAEIEIRNIESINEGVLKVTAYVPENTEIGFKDLTATNLLLGKSATLLNGLYVGPRIGQDGEDGEDGEVGPQGPIGEDGMSICNNSEDSLKIFTNNLPPGSQATSFFDPVLCNLTLGIPVGFNGINGTTGTKGDIGSSGVKGDTGAIGSKGDTGIVGSNGSNGLSSLIKVTSEAEGSNCDKGGIKVETGLDSNQNNVLDSGETSTTNYVCNGKKDK